MLKAIGSIAAVALAVPALAVGSGLGIANPGKPDVKVLFKQAVTKVKARPGFSKAVMLEADGTPSSGKVTTAAGITKWRFVFNNQGTPGSNFKSAFLYYVGNHWGLFVPKAGIFLEDLNLPNPPKLTLAMAVSKLRAAGYRAGFYNVTLRRPVAQHVSPEPLYIFGFGSQAKQPYVSVGSTTGKVKKIS